MSVPARRSQTRKWTLLPSGRIVFDDDPEFGAEIRTIGSAEERAPVAEPAHQRLDVCDACGSRLVYPTHWQERDRCRWFVQLRCPNCEHTREGVFDDHVVEEFDIALDCATAKLESDLSRFAYENLLEYSERFIRALALDAIQPSDF